MDKQIELNVKLNTFKVIENKPIVLDELPFNTFLPNKEDNVILSNGIVEVVIARTKEIELVAILSLYNATMYKILVDKKQYKLIMEKISDAINLYNQLIIS